MSQGFVTSPDVIIVHSALGDQVTASCVTIKICVDLVVILSTEKVQFWQAGACFVSMGADTREYS